MDAAWTQPSIFKNFRAPHGRAPKNSEPLMDTAFNFQDFKAPHGRALKISEPLIKISEPLMGAALNFANFLSATCSRPKTFGTDHWRSREFCKLFERHMVAP